MKNKKSCECIVRDGGGGSFSRKKIFKATMIWGFSVTIIIGLTVVFRKILMPTIYFYATTQMEELGFPEFMSNSELSYDVKNLLSLAKNEYENPKSGEFYADGVREPWCADLVSFLFKEAGHPFKNPHTGYWRIPGVYTLKEYLRSIDAWHPEPEYRPQPGDIVIYDGGLFGTHTNLVIAVEENYIVTMGGNEGGRIRLDKIDWTDKKYGVSGFGRIL